MMANNSGLPRYQFERLTHNNWDTFEFLMQQLLVQLGLWKYVQKTGLWLVMMEKEEFSKWEEGCKKAWVEIALCVTAEVMHIIQALEDPVIIWENFKTTLGS